VLISYQKGDVERQEFVEALAHSLQDDFCPWYDEWKIKPGDSLPREIGTVLAEAYAVIFVLSSSTGFVRGLLHYMRRQLGWAGEEFEAAITKRIPQGTPVISIGPPYRSRGSS